jgi:uncharacterized protein (DUF58 family)
MWSLKPSSPELHELRLEIGRVLSGFVGGLHRSVIKDKGAEFLNLRPYQHSDTLKQIDWMASARLSEDDLNLVTKEFAPERQIHICVLADESITMSALPKKAMCAQSLLQLFALSAFASDDLFSVIGFNGDRLITSGVLRNEDALATFLDATDRPPARRGLYASTTSLVAHFDELQMGNALVVVLSDIARLDKFPLYALRSMDVGRANVTVVSIVLDEWSGFYPSTHLLHVMHPETGKMVAMDLRPRGEFARQVEAFESRLEAHRDAGRSIGMRVLSIALSGSEPLRQFARDWIRIAGE